MPRNGAIPKHSFKTKHLFSIENFTSLEREPMTSIESSIKITEHEFGSFLNDMPIHTQAVERCVKVVTEVSKKVCGQDARNGMIANIIASRNNMSIFNSKQDYNLECEKELTQLKM